MIKRITLLVTISFLSLSTPVLAAEPGDGTIEGQVVNGTEGGSSVADLDMTLKTYLNNNEVGTATTRADAEGQFAFTGLSTESGYSYEVTLTYQEADYYGDLLSFDEGETTKYTEVIVYDSTTSDEAIKVATAHTIIYVRQGNLQIEEYYLFVNEADRTYIGSGEITAAGTRRTLMLQLPDKITELQYGGELMSCCVVPGDQGFFDTMPVLPGVKNIAYYYQVSYGSGEYMYSQRVNYPIIEFTLLIQGESVEVVSDWLVQGETREDSQGDRYELFSGSDFAPGDILVARFSNLPSINNQMTIIWAVLALTLVAGTFGVGYRLRKKRSQPVSPKGSPEQKRRRLLVELAGLDDDFEAGKIPEESYHQRRAAKKAELVELMQSRKRSAATDNGGS